MSGSPPPAPTSGADTPDPAAARRELFAFMTAASDQMAAEYERIRRHAAEDPGTAGDQGEENWAKLLRDWLPAGYKVVTKGRVLGLSGRSPQVDVIVLAPGYPPALVNNKLYLAAGVAAAFECKLTLTADGVRDAVIAGRAVRRLAEVRVGSPYRELHSPVTFGLLAHSHAWKGQASTPIRNVENALLENEQQLVEHPREMLDILCIADLATWIATRQTFVGPSLFGETWSASAALYDYPLEGCCSTAYMGPNIDSPQAMPRPVGVMFAKLLTQLAWEDTSLRAFADYWRLAGMHGPGAGRPRSWRVTDVYSPGVAPQVTAGQLTNGESWSEWDMFFL